MIINYHVEQINVSDDEYMLVEMAYESGTYVEKNELLFCYESSKSVNEVQALESGYLYFNPNCELKESYGVGFKLAIQVPERISDDDIVDHFALEKSNKDPQSSNIKISKKAQKLIDSSSLTLSDFEGNEIISEQLVNERLLSLSPAINQLATFSGAGSERDFFSTKKLKLAVIGAGKAALQLYDSLSSSEQFELVKFYDADIGASQKKLFGVDIVRGDIVENVTADFAEGQFDKCIISFSGNLQARRNLYEKLKNQGIQFANIIHHTAYISEHCLIGEGNLIFANVRIGPFCSVGNNNVISAVCSIEHNNIIGSHNTFGPGVLFSGSCSVGDGNKFGTMIGVEPNVVIGCNNIIASSQVITTPLGDGKLVRSKGGAEIKVL